MVRDDKVKHKVLRIFKIWGERGVYDDSFITDLSGLMNLQSKKKSAEPEPDSAHDPLDFQPNMLFTKIRSCHKLEDDTDLRLKRLNESHVSFSDADALRSHLKDRRQGDDIVAEVDEGVKMMEAYMKALEKEIKERKHLINELDLANKFYETQQGDAKLVVNAYKNFGSRVRNLKRHLDEKLPSFESINSTPVLSPDYNAPSPSPDCDIELPGDDGVSFIPGFSDQPYVPDDEEQPFASFLGNGSLPFDFQKNLFSEYDDQGDPGGKPIEVINSRSEMESNISNFIKSLGNINSNSPTPGNPVPAVDSFASHLIPQYNNATDEAEGTVDDEYNYPINISPAPIPPPPLPPNLFSALPNKFPTWEEDDENWEPEENNDTPESPPMCEKEGFRDPLVYDGTATLNVLGSRSDVDHRTAVGRLQITQVDVDHRLLHIPEPPKEDIDHRMHKARQKDVDHRNLISLTGSPSQEVIPHPPIPPTMAWSVDQDYRNLSGPFQNVNTNFGSDVDFRIPPPPPPPLPSEENRDNVESVDMDLSDEESVELNTSVESASNNGSLLEDRISALNDGALNKLTRTDQPPITFNIANSVNKLLPVSPLNEGTEERNSKMRLFDSRKLPFRTPPVSPYTPHIIRPVGSQMSDIRPLPPVFQQDHPTPPNMNIPLTRMNTPTTQTQNAPPPLKSIPSLLSNPIKTPPSLKLIRNDSKLMDQIMDDLDESECGDSNSKPHVTVAANDKNAQQSANGCMEAMMTLEDELNWPGSDEENNDANVNGGFADDLDINGMDSNQPPTPLHREPLIKESPFRDPHFRELPFRDSSMREPPFRDPHQREPPFGEPHSMRELPFGKPHNMREPPFGDPHMREPPFGEPHQREPPFGEPHNMREPPFGEPPFGEPHNMREPPFGEPHNMREPPFREPHQREPPFGEPHQREPPFGEPHNRREPPFGEPHNMREPPFRDPHMREPPFRDPHMRETPFGEPLMREPPFGEPHSIDSQFRVPLNRKFPLREPDFREPPFQKDPFRWAKNNGGSNNNDQFHENNEMTDFSHCNNEWENPGLMEIPRHFPPVPRNEFQPRPRGLRRGGGPARRMMRGRGGPGGDRGCRPPFRGRQGDFGGW